MLRIPSKNARDQKYNDQVNQSTNQIIQNQLPIKSIKTINLLIKPINLLTKSIHKFSDQINQKLHTCNQ